MSFVNLRDATFVNALERDIKLDLTKVYLATSIQ